MLVVIELQTTNGATTLLTDTFSDRAAAENKYHTILSAAAVSSIEEHAAVMMDHKGFVIKNEIYYHPQTPESITE